MVTLSIGYLEEAFFSDLIKFDSEKEMLYYIQSAYNTVANIQYRLIVNGSDYSLIIT